MDLHCSFLAFFLVLVTTASAQFTEDFTDGDLIADPAWSGDLELFTVVDDDGDLQLRSNSPGAATYFLSTPSSLASNAFWEILVDLRLNTSGSNYVDIFLISDGADMVAAQNAWYVRIGGTQDRVELFKKVAGTVTSVLTSTDGVVNSTTSNLVRLRVERTADLIWTLLYDDGDTGTFAAIGPVTDPDVSTATHFGILIEQNSTASMVNNHFFDDIVVDILPVDEVAPELIGVNVIDPNSLQLLFTETITVSSAEQPGNYSVDNGIGEPIGAIAQGNSVQLVFDQQFIPGTLYTLTVDGVQDQSGNTTIASAEFLLPDEAEPGDLVINEVLYDPIGSGADFVELYNRSGKAIDLTGMQMANMSNGVVANYELIDAAQWILMPGEFVVLTPDVEDILSNYPQSHADRFLQTDLPNYVNTEGTVVVLDSAGTVIDQFTYHDDLHFDLISSAEGFSLERIDPDRPADDPTNWQSASEVAGRATPGFQNSQHAPAPEPRGSMTIDPPIFSPDNDGSQDVLTITYAFDQDGFAGSIMIFDLAGRQVRQLMANKLLGTSGSISWDGILDDGSKGRIGPYIVMMEAFDLEGNVQRSKKTITLAHFLDH